MKIRAHSEKDNKYNCHKDMKTLRFTKSIILMNYLGISSFLCTLVAKKDFSEQAQD